MTSPTGIKPTLKRWRDRATRQRWLGVILIALSIASVISVAVQTQRLSDATECQTEYNRAYTTAIKQRGDAAREERAAQRKLLTTLLGEAVTPAEGRAAFDEYLSTLDAVDRERDAAAIPTRRC